MKQVVNCLIAIIKHIACDIVAPFVIGFAIFAYFFGLAALLVFSMYQFSVLCENLFKH